MPVIPNDAGQHVPLLAPPRHRLLPRAPISVGLIAVGLVGGFTAARLIDDPVTAKPESMTGTVTWSNERSRLIAFEADGVARDPSAGDTIYSVLANNWQDTSGTRHGEGSYPTCLAGNGDDPVSMDRHRAELWVLRQDTGGQPVNIAVDVHCLD